MSNTPPEPGLHLAISGHRFLADALSVVEFIYQILERVAQDYPGQTWIVLSPLAEGADQLVVERILLKYPSAHLHVPLPMAQDAYLKTFSTQAGQENFHRLFALAQKTVEMPAVPSAEEAFLQLGRYLIAHADLLIAIWDGQPARGPGGTSDVVQMARQNQLPLAWINPQETVHKHGASPLVFENFDRIKSGTS